MSRLVHMPPLGWRREDVEHALVDVRKHAGTAYPCGATMQDVEDRYGRRATTYCSYIPYAVTCEACRHAVQQREAG